MIIKEVFKTFPNSLPINPRNDSILSAHDFDAGYVLKLLEKEFKIIGIPSSGDTKEIYGKVLKLIKNN